MTSTQSKSDLEQQLKEKEVVVKKLDQSIEKEIQINKELNKELEQAKEEKIKLHFDNVKKLIKDFTKKSQEKSKSEQVPQLKQEINTLKEKGLVTKGIKRLESFPDIVVKTQSTNTNSDKNDDEKCEESLLERERTVTREAKKLENLRFVLKVDRRELYKERKILTQTQLQYDELKEELLKKMKQLQIERQQFESQREVFKFDKKNQSKQELKKTAQKILETIISDSIVTKPKQNYYDLFKFEPTVEKDDFTFKVYIIKREQYGQTSKVHSKELVGQFSLKLDRSKSFSDYQLSTDNDTLTPCDLLSVHKNLISIYNGRLNLVILQLSHNLNIRVDDRSIIINKEKYKMCAYSVLLYSSLMNFFLEYSKKLSDHSDIVAQEELDKYESLNMYGSSNGRFKDYYNYADSTETYRKKYKQLLLSHGTI